MCEEIAAAGFSEKNLLLACVITELLNQRKPDTVRGIMYAAVSVGTLPDTGKQSYGKAQRLLNELRRRGVVPFAWIVDNIRATEKPSSWSGLEDFTESVQKAYRKNFWASLPQYVAIIVEKDTVAGRVLPVTRKYDVPLHPLRGFSSTSFAFSIAETWKRIRKPIFVYYIGDHDPSGREIERSVQQRLAEYSGKAVTWQRLAVTPSQFAKFGMIPLAPKKKDSRYRQFATKFGERCAEVEAIPADALRGMVEEAILAHIPADEWARLQEIERQERESFTQVISMMKGGT